MLFGSHPGPPGGIERGKYRYLDGSCSGVSAEDGPTVRYYAEMPVKDKTTEEWLKGNAAYLASTKPAGEA